MQKSIPQNEKESDMSHFALNELSTYQKMLLENNIIDFDCNNLIHITYSLLLVTSALCKYINSISKIETFIIYLEDLIKTIKEKKIQYIKRPTLLNLYIVQNHIIFLLILILNIKDNDNLILCIFNKKANFVSKLIEYCKDAQKIKPETKSDDNIISGLLHSLFITDYIPVFFRTPQNSELEEIYVKEYKNFLKKFSKYKVTIPSLNKESYVKLFDVLKACDISYDNYFDNKLDTIEHNEKNLLKLCISQSVIRIVFSKEKANYYPHCQYFEYDFLHKIISKNMDETKKIFKDKYTSLFRKEDLYDDIIKYLFFIFGNKMMIMSFYKPFEHLVANSEVCQYQLTEENLGLFFTEMLTHLEITMPIVLKIVLKLVYQYCKSTFTIEYDNYSPLYTLLMFNFLISPRVQDIYKLNPLKEKLLWNLNKLIRNTCYLTQFSSTDELAPFNDYLQFYNKEFNAFIKKNIIDFDETQPHIQSSLNNLFTESYLTYPSFLFRYDSLLLTFLIRGGSDNIIVYEDT